MLIRNDLPEYGIPLETADAGIFGINAPDAVIRFLAAREDYRPTPLIALPGLAAGLGVASIHVKDEGQRLGLGSFKALGGAYAVVSLAVEKASDRLGHPIDIGTWRSPAVAEAAAHMTFCCATDGNHGRSVAQGASLIGAGCVIFVHSGVSDARVAAIAGYGARIVRVDGTYDDSVVEAARVTARNGWVAVSDTSWPGHERIPLLVMQGYTAMLRETSEQMPQPPTHVFIQAGVGGVAAAVAAHFVAVHGADRPFVTVVEPSRAACLLASMRAGCLSAAPRGEPTVMAMLECHEPSPVAWRILSRLADAFMTVEDEDAVTAMNRLGQPCSGDTRIVAGESGGAGLAGLLRAAGDPDARRTIGLDADARIFLINTEGATDPQLYQQLTGLSVVV